MAMVDVDGSSKFSADSQPKSTGLVWGLAATRPAALSLRPSDELGELSQWLSSWRQHYEHCRGYYYYFFIPQVVKNHGVKN